MKNIFFYLTFLLISNFIHAQTFKIKSPNGQLELEVEASEKLYWKTIYNGNEVINKTAISLAFTSGITYGVNCKVLSNKVNTVNQTIVPGVSHKDAKINDHYTELTLNFEGNYNLKFRAYNEGVAYQFLDQVSSEREVLNEQMNLSLPQGTKSFFPQENSMYSHNERLYLNKEVKDIESTQFCSLPVLFSTDYAKILFTETALHNYPGMFLKGNMSNSLDVIHPKYILKLHDSEKRPDRTEIIDEEAKYIAKINGSMQFPWRVFIISNDDRTFVESNLTYQMARPQAINDVKWIKPGKVAWDWYNANNIYGVNFKSGINTQTYKYYIDFAAKNKLEYIIVDEGWTKTTTNLLEMNPEIDIKELIRYGKTKNVGVILWVLWKPLDKNTDEILKLYQSWGTKGVKVDFMQRNDQYMVEYYEKIAKKCAEYKLLVDFHGSFKPSGLEREYPNVVNYEGVKGNENHKWSKDITPEHNVTLPFIRMVAGPMDYTPGAMVTEHEKFHAINFNRPVGIGTRAHQVAMYVVYEAPLQMLCDNPTTYNKEQETVNFISKIPTVWDETKVLHGKVGDYIIIARRKDSNWYIGGMTDATSRNFDIDLSFLDKGKYSMQVLKDGINVDKFAQDYAIETTNVTKDSKINLIMSSGGGWTAILTPVK